MRFLLQILGLLVIVLIGWNQPFCDVARTMLPWAQIPPSRLSMIKGKSKGAVTPQGALPPAPSRPQFSPATSMGAKPRP